MKYVPRMPIPWDMVVFLTITTAGFGFSVHRLLDENRFALAPDRQINLESSKPEAIPATADLGCLERSLPTQQMESEAGTIRLRGRFCHLSSRAMRSFDGIQIRNLTNGFEGTVFFQGYDASFVTDYVLLKPGRNEIQIEWRESASKPVRKVLAEVFER